MLKIVVLFQVFYGVLKIKNFISYVDVCVGVLDNFNKVVFLQG